jgi:hypothetical protein
MKFVKSDEEKMTRVSKEKGPAYEGESPEFYKTLELYEHSAVYVVDEILVDVVLAVC